MRAFPGIRIEGGLFSPDLPDLVLAGELPGQKPADFGLAGRRDLTDEIAAVFADAEALWRVFRRRLARLPAGDYGTTLVRDGWMVPLCGLLGFELCYNRTAHVVDGMTFAVSHNADADPDAPPVHIVGARLDLGRVAPGGKPRLAPHALLQEFLNRTEALWGLVTNGNLVRLLRNSTFIRRSSFVEFDLETIFEQRLFPDFAVFYRLLHRSRFPGRGVAPHRCYLERYYQLSVEQGGRVRERLRDGVEACIRGLADGFLAHTANEGLRKRLALGPAAPEGMTPEDFYREILLLVYRFLFLLVAEDRDLVSQNRLYREHYGVGRLRRLAERSAGYSDHDDLWLSLKVLWKLLSDDTLVQQFGNKPAASLLGLPVLNGNLFEPLEIDACRITNRALLAALENLMFYREKPSAPPRRVNYAALDVEELGSVYESLLDYHPVVDLSRTNPRFNLVYGSERKSTGSYYTPAELVAELTRTALDPVLRDRLKGIRDPAEAEKALLAVRVLDPACGSGHFLLAAARRMGKVLAQIRTREDEPAPERIRDAVRDVVSHCIYGADKNPLAVELCRVALWIESHSPGKPLAFLDHRIKCGDSLVGVFDLRTLEDGIPDGAFNPVSADDRKKALDQKKANRQERTGQVTLFDRLSFETTREDLAELADTAAAINRIPDDSPEAVREKKKRFTELERRIEPKRIACNIWTAAFFQPRNDSIPYDARIGTDTLRSFMLRLSAPPRAVAYADEQARNHRFFHWPLEFPEVFKNGGFDVVLGNPPWERIKLQEKEFFATRDPHIAAAPNAARRKAYIRSLPIENPALWREYEDARHTAESASRFLRYSEQYPLTGHGDINTYSVFAERMRRLLNPGGRAGIVVPTGIATDDTNKRFFARLAEKGEVATLFDFENREKIFPAVDSRYKFCLLVMTARRTERARYAFFCTRPEHLRDPRRTFELTPGDIAAINPNTGTLPVFRTRQDADLTRDIYRRVPVLINEKMGKNPWDVSFKQGLFNMSSDSGLFRTAGQLRAEGFRRIGNRFVKDGDLWLPLYEAKMIWHFDHRFGTYEGLPKRSGSHLPTPDDARHADPGFLVQPWYWVPAAEVGHRLQSRTDSWMLGFRDVTNATNERTAIFSLLPRAGVGHKVPILFPDVENCLKIYLFSCACSIVFDYFVRQKIGGTSLGYFILKQLPVLSPTIYKIEDRKFIISRALELVYTAWDMKPFADDVWRDAGADVRAAIRRMWEANAGEAGGHTWDPPPWIDAYPEIVTDPGGGIPFPPFRWHAGRRERLRAELDALYARLYGLTRKQLRYILDPADLTAGELADILDPREEVSDPLDAEGYAVRTAASDFPGETFRVLKEKEMKRYGEYRTRRLILEAWEEGVVG